MAQGAREVIAFGRAGELVISATGDVPIDDGSWKRYLDQVAEMVQTQGAGIGTLIWSPTHGPTAAQRKLMVENYHESTRLDLLRRSAVISESVVVRGAVTAMGWFARNVKLRSFRSSDVSLALDWLAEDVKFDRREAEVLLDRLIRAVK